MEGSKRGIRYWLRGLRHGLFLLPALLAALLYLLLPAWPGVTEAVFSRGVFRLISVPLGGLISILPCSLTELLVIGSLPLLVLLICLLVRRLRRSDHRGRTLARVGKGIGWVLSSVLLIYVLLHGLNFYRLSVPELMDLDVSQKSPEWLQQVCIDLAQKAGAAREGLAEDDKGRMELSASRLTTLRQAGDGFRRADDTYPFLWGAVWQPKPVMLSHWWSYTGITGVYFPFFAEANVNIDVPDSSIPATAAHELAHTRGFAREDECNFFAFLTCANNESAEYRYSGYLMAYIYCSNALYDYDGDMWDEVQGYVSDGMRRDMDERGEYWKQFEGKVQEVSSSVNDAFITIQGDDDGILSYSRVVELILAYYEKTGFAAS